MLILHLHRAPGQMFEVFVLANMRSKSKDETHTSQCQNTTVVNLVMKIQEF